MNIQAELISIGNELLSGQTLNTHGRDLGAALAAIGLELTRDTTIADDIPTIKSAVAEAFQRTDLVFVSGGLGPTVDDITRDALAEAFDRLIVPHRPTIEIIAQRYTARGRVMNSIAERQGLILDGATVLPNSVGAAPGQRLELPGAKTLLVLPGPPHEFNAILNEEIMPWLQQRYADARPKQVRLVQTKGIGESDIVALLDAAAFSTGAVDIGFYPANGKVKIRLTAEHDQAEQIQHLENSLLSVLSDFIELDSKV